MSTVMRSLQPHRPHNPELAFPIPLPSWILAAHHGSARSSLAPSTSTSTPVVGLAMSTMPYRCYPILVHIGTRIKGQRAQSGKLRGIGWLGLSYLPRCLTFAACILGVQSCRRAAHISAGERVETRVDSSCALWDTSLTLESLQTAVLVTHVGKDEQ